MRLPSFATLAMLAAHAAPKITLLYLPSSDTDLHKQAQWITWALSTPTLFTAAAGLLRGQKSWPALPGSSGNQRSYLNVNVEKKSLPTRL